MLRVPEAIRESYKCHFSDSYSMRKALLFQFSTNTIISGLYVALVSSVSKDALIAIVTFLSIIIGFSYSIMIFVSSNPFVRSADASDREARLRAGRLNELVENLYKNLNFFCRFCLFMVLLSVLGVAGENLFKGPLLIVDLSRTVFFYLAISTNFVFVWLLVELGAEFWRILERTNYLFSSRIRQFRN